MRLISFGGYRDFQRESFRTFSYASAVFVTGRTDSLSSVFLFKKKKKKTYARGEIRTKERYEYRALTTPSLVFP
jgi:hypothetical protein